ncbi:MAG TPA: acyltransferase [Chthoniobacteraceae bacterium]|jgi:carbonic anhydrase/acetyltransferase-like protein (isoleucine patch superfamily)|nr:acyltransferase [Chthoniobacteraceae bacterium]
MGLIYDKATFRVRALVREWLCDRPRTLYWRALGLRTGPRTLLPRIRVTWPHQVSLGARCVLEPDVFFRFNGIWAAGPAITIGDDSFIGTGCEFNARKKIAIGNHALIAPGCRFIDHDHGYSSRTQPMAEQVDGGEDAIILEDDVWIGVNAVVLKGVTIGRGAIVAAGSVVTKSIGAYEIWAGVPARKIRVRPDAAA